MIGIFGGTFDPVHIGHLRTALEVYEALGLAELRLVPLGRAVHRAQPRFPAALRLEMLEAALAGQPGFEVDRREIDADRPSYTVDTLASLRRELGGEVSLCLLLGRDAFAAFHTWRQPKEILKLAHLVVMERPGEPLFMEEGLEALAEGRITAQAADLHKAPAGRILFQPVSQLEISSSDIRRRLDAGLSVRWLVPEAVWRILQR